MITLSNGTQLIIDVTTISGMAGEPMEIVRLITDDGKVHRFDTVKSLMNPEDAKEVAELLKEVAESNHFSAVAFVI